MFATYTRWGKQHRGFTLAELLISLAILGVIATFTIPKILANQQNSQKKAVFKESISAVSNAVYIYCLNPSIYPNPTALFDYMTSQINTAKQCNSNALTQGCSPATPGGSGEATEPGFVMHNGSSFAGLNGMLGGNNEFIMDWNGIAEPNLDGDDQLKLAINLTTTSGWAGVRQCTVGPLNTNTPSYDLWQTIFE